ncbi:SDR family NAD(P)-dependent oxidoreductase [Nocardiopsis sp. HNM0947]|uniref:SDR family NAD(P)-dependent oxidoreductase n=1 Tax=Nocardiopsis coralli TaxID=2772213 RepID=A0ABR9NZT3_9ACTN|nr:SDR family NAD(P)-dependent oxidoreductase [Nocardiopsis coralli]MBE2997097.1 SDR family NAD(P)-dependent oxidoreductase [Nocardiopsis coralli]
MIDPHTYGPWAVIAGGSEGVGASFARLLAGAGINLVLVARKPGPLEETAAQVRAQGVLVRTVQKDLTEPDAAEAVAGAASDVDVGLLVFNAGANSYGHEFVTSDPDRVQGVLDLNIGCQLALVRHFGAAMKRRGHGGVLLVGSMAGFLGQAHMSVYSAAKAFGRVFAEGLWLELGEHDVDVLELVLGVTRTPAMERAGLRMDLPGLEVSEPDDVAREGLAHLADGPVHVVGGNAAAAEKRSGFPRAPLVAGAHESTKRLLGRG